MFSTFIQLPCNVMLIFDGYILHSLFSTDGVPPDGTPIKIVNILEIWVPILGAFLQSISLSFVIICLSFNIIFRKRKLVIYRMFIVYAVVM